eukprot:SAG22_NODE_13390_length_408_cov_1.126214_1_plen_42_part_01
MPFLAVCLSCLALQLGLELVIGCSGLPAHADHDLDTRVMVRE